MSSADDSGGPDSAECESFGFLCFYHVERIRDVEAECAWQRDLLERQSIGGRLRVAPAGLNAALSGSLAALAAYRAEICARFEHGAGIDWKLDRAAEAPLFATLSVRSVAEIVSLGVPESAGEWMERHVLPFARGKYGRRRGQASARGGGALVAAPCSSDAEDAIAPTTRLLAGI